MVSTERRAAHALFLDHDVCLDLSLSESRTLYVCPSVRFLPLSLLAEVVVVLPAAAAAGDAEQKTLGRGHPSHLAKVHSQIASLSSVFLHAKSATAVGGAALFNTLRSFLPACKQVWC